MRSGRVFPLLLGALAACGAPPAQPGGERGTITIVIGAEPTLPVPTLSSFRQNQDVASLLFLPLARLPRDLAITDETAFEPALASGWERRDSLTLAFTIDARARWHDGQPVTSRDVVWSFERARDSTIAPTQALLLREVRAVEADGERGVVVRFRRAYAEQMYDAVSQVTPLPAHLLDTIPPASLPTSAYVRAPVGNGPYRWGQLVPDRQLELVANEEFFLGTPPLQRVVFVLARGAEAQLNLVLDGTADAYESVFIERNAPAIADRADLRLTTLPSLTAAYLLFNQRAYGDRTKPHPILADSSVRLAIAHAIDRPTLIRSVFGRYGTITDGPIGQASWLRRIAPPGPALDTARARTLLAAAGWTDSDGDGVVDRRGRPLVLRLNYPGTSVPRVALAEPIQEMLRRVGIRLELVRLDGPVWFERRQRGEFDIDFSQANLDPAPSGLVQSWSCAGIGGSNVGHTCNPGFDSALAAATRATGGAEAAWTAALTELQRTTPAVFLYSPATTVLLQARYRDVSFRPEAAWADLWRWSVAEGQQLARDRQAER